MKAVKRLRSTLSWKEWHLFCHPQAEELEPRLPPGDVLFGGMLARFWLDQSRPVVDRNPAIVASFRGGEVLSRDWLNSFIGTAETLNPDRSLNPMAARLLSGQHRSAFSGDDSAALSLVTKTGPEEQAPVRPGIDGLFSTKLTNQGAVDLDAGILDYSLVSGTLDDLAEASGSSDRTPATMTTDHDLVTSTGADSGAIGSAIGVSSPSLPAFPATGSSVFAENLARPLGHADNLTAEIVALGSGRDGSPPPPGDDQCILTGGQGLATNQLEGQYYPGGIANISLTGNPCNHGGGIAAQADFGDGQSNVPVYVLGDPTSGFYITEGSHVYMEEGTFPVTIRVMDEFNNALTLHGTSNVADSPLHWNPNPPVFNWSVPTNNNQPPTFTSNPGTQQTAEGAPVSLQLQANDPDGDGLSFGAVGLPPGLTISTGGLISGTMDYAAAEYANGSYNVTAVVADGHGASAKESFTWMVTDTPQALVLTNPGNQTNAEGDSPFFDLSGNDPDGNPLTYTATGLPPGVSLDPDTGLLSGQISPTAANGSPYTVTATLSDGIPAHNVSQTFTWTVTHLGLTNPGSQVNVNGDAVSLQLQANDVDGDILTYSMANGSTLPPGLALSSGLISGTLAANADARSPYTVMLTASDGMPAHNVNQNFTWTVAHMSLANPGNQANADQDNVSLQLQGHDADSDALTYSLTSGALPPGLMLASNGLISGTIAANADMRSPYTATVTATDQNQAHSSSQTFTWTVTHILLTSPGNQNTGDGDAVSLQVMAHDHDDANLNYTANGLPPGLTIGQTTGLISGTVAATADVNSPYTVTVTADDANPANLVSQTFTWSVFQHVQVTAPNNRSNADGDMVSLPISASDPEDGDALTYTANTLPPGLMLDPNTGLIQGQLAANADANSPYMVTITAKDANGNYSASQTFTWTVAPVGLANPGTQNNANGDTLNPPLQLQGRGNNLTYSLTNGILPPNLTLANNGLISGTIAGNADVGSPYTVTVTATDSGGHSASQTFTWTVTHVALTNPGNQTNSDMDSVSLQLQGHDADRETVTYAASNLPPGLMLNTSTGLISGTLDGNADVNSPYTVTVSATDLFRAHTTSQTFTWTVVPRITITPPGDQLNADGDTVSLPITASDADNLPLSYNLSGQPLGLTITSGGVITGSIQSTDDTTSPYLVTVSASDGTVTASQTFTWSIAHILVTPPGDQSSTDSQIVSLPIQTQHADMAPVTFSALGLPPNLTINASTGVISGKLSLTADGGSPYTVTVQATEGTYSAGQTFTWTVSPLMVMSPTNQSHVAGTTVSLPIHVHYSGTAPLAFSATGLPPGLAIDQQTGVIAGRITPSAVWRRYNTAVTVTDGPHHSGTAFLWTVSPPGNQPPVITNPGNQVNNEDDDIALPIQASDPDGDPLTYGATGLPSGLSIDPGSGVITGSLDDAAFSDMPFSVTVTVNDGNGNTASQTFNWQFIAPALTASPATVNATEGTEFAGTVANFTNANVGSDEFADEYDVTIDWGDGTGLDTGTATGSNGSYSVFGDHVYQENGSYAITVTITDESLASTTVTSTATVTDTPATATAVPVSLLVGSGAMVPVATFTDLNPDDADYAATITWGDGGGSSTGTISGLNGKYVVSGSHAYALHGPYTVHITITDGGVPVGTASTTATVADFYEGQLNLNIAGFTDDDSYGMLSDYTSTVQWGDGTSDSNGVITPDRNTPGLLDLNESHAYAPGAYNNITVTIRDAGGSFITSPAQSLIIAEQPLTAYTAPIYANAGVPLNNTTLALFTDPDPNGSASGATLDWGDGSSGQGSVSNSGGIISVTGSHTYSDSGTYPLSLFFQSVGASLYPVIVSALAANLAQTVKPKRDSAPGAGGTFSWDLSAPSPKGASMDATFTFAPKTCACRNIVFLQEVIKDTVGVNNEPDFPKPKEFYEKLALPGFTGSHLDVRQIGNRKPNNPYYQMNATATGVIPRPPTTGTVYPAIGDGTSSPKFNAKATDEPTHPRARTLGNFYEKFETAAFCIDSQEILGVLTWGFQIEKTDSTTALLFGTKKDDFSLKPSTTFQKMIQHTNGDVKQPNGVEGVMRYAHYDYNAKPKPILVPKITIPDHTRVNCKGTSALPENSGGG